jgi:hypothetical protein
MRTYVRASTGGTASGAGAHRSRAERLRGRAPARRAAPHGARLAHRRTAGHARDLPALLAADVDGALRRERLRRARRALPRRRPHLAVPADAATPAHARREVPGHRERGRRAARPRRARLQGRAPRGPRGADGHALVVHSHWSCLLPQHGPGKKHDRRILLEPWQERQIEAAPWRFLRGCIRSDGCVFINRTGKYAYESYDFCNLSDDIRALFAAVCASVGVDCRVYAKRVRIYRRASVRLLLEHVGRKQ